VGFDRFERPVRAIRMRRTAWTARLGGALVLAWLPLAAHGEVLSRFDYTVLRDGEPIGTHRVTVSPAGRNIEVEEQSDVAVTFGPVTFYRMAHLRRELWRDGVLETLVAQTDKNGDLYHIEITREPDGYKRVVNGRTERFPPSVKPLALWHEDLFTYTSFLSPVEDKTFEISIDFVGAEKLESVGQSVNAFIYRLSGDTNREVWYDADGLILKVRLLDHSPTIEYVLSATSAAPSPGIQAEAVEAKSVQANSASGANGAAVPAGARR
jgi:hypothetical protein